MTAILFLFGLILGSFFNVVIYRLPRNESLAFPRSHCPECSRQLTSVELIPVVSYLIQRGRCRGCGAKIAWQYPVVELLTACGFALIGTVSSGLSVIAWLIFFSLLLVLAVIDIKHQSLPNVLTVPGMGVGIVCSLLGLTIPLRHSLFGIAVGGAVILIIHLITKGGMGMGDMKLLAMIGSFLGPWQSLQTLFWGSLFGSIFGVAYLIKTKQGRKTPIPFGPFLSLGALIALFRII